VSKKKKCKKKKKAPTTPTPIQLPAPGPVVRATLSWSANDEVDLHAFDSSGNHAGWVEPTGVVNNIPNARHNGDAGPFGPSESFIDDIFVSGGSTNREFAFVACLYDFPLASSYSATFTAVTADGHSSTVPLAGPGVYSVTIDGGPPVPSNPC
jgi:hypothetical protein